MVHIEGERTTGHPRARDLPESSKSIPVHPVIPDLSQISQMSPAQIYGSAVIIYLLITSARKNNDNDVDLSKSYKEIFSAFTSIYISRISIVLISWGTVYFMYWVFSLLG